MCIFVCTRQSPALVRAGGQTAAGNRFERWSAGSHTSADDRFERWKAGDRLLLATGSSAGEPAARLLLATGSSAGKPAARLLLATDLNVFCWRRVTSGVCRYAPRCGASVFRVGSMLYKITTTREYVRPGLVDHHLMAHNNGGCEEFDLRLLHDIIEPMPRPLLSSGRPFYWFCELLY